MSEIEVCGSGERWPVLRWFPDSLWWHAVDSDSPPPSGVVVTALCHATFVLELTRSSRQRAMCPWCAQQAREVRGRKMRR